MRSLHAHTRYFNLTPILSDYAQLYTLRLTTLSGSHCRYLKEIDSHPNTPHTDSFTTLRYAIHAIAFIRYGQHNESTFRALLLSHDMTAMYLCLTSLVADAIHPYPWRAYLYRKTHVKGQDTPDTHRGNITYKANTTQPMYNQYARYRTSYKIQLYIPNA
jgi:hypothetical protein